MKDDEAVEEVVVFVDTGGHGVPVVGGDGRGIEEGVKFQDAIADVARVSRRRGTKGWDGDEFSEARGLEFDWGVCVSDEVGSE